MSHDERSAVAIRELPTRDVVGLVGALRGAGPAWLLDSALRSGRLGRFSFAGVDPYLVVRARGDAVALDTLRPVRCGARTGRELRSGDPLQIVRALMPAPPVEPTPTALPFVGGAVGYLGYELAAHFDAHAFHGRDDLQLPDLTLLFVDALIAHDALTDRLYACGLGFDARAARARRRAERACDRLVERIGPIVGPPAGRDAKGAARPGAGPWRDASRPPGGAPAALDASAYAKAVDAVVQEIEAGEVYQACLTRRAGRDYPGDPWELYRRLREINPAPFASYLELPDVTVVSSSPERFVRLEAGGRVESRPIKGTRPRGATPRADAALRAELASSAKERAENLMIVDLVRNDIGRVCETGSVAVPELMAIESYASVHQMVSTVSGRLRADRDAFDLVRATFPPGSMTGAPKIAAMRLLDRLEPVRRGVYSGAVGYFDVRGGADWSVVIRTILLQRGRAWLHTGGGIVADSDPAAEWAETIAKARPLHEALGG